MNQALPASQGSPTLFVAGAAGALGRHVLQEAARRGAHVRALINDALLSDAPDTVEIRRANALNASELRDACDGIETVFSALGASVLPDFRKGRRSYYAVDTKANHNLIAVAKDAGVRRFVYVSVACHRALSKLAYVRAHEHVVDALAASGIAYTVIRPTGFFSAFATMLPMAAKGRMPIIGDGSAKTNPIHDGELASMCVDAFDADMEEIEIGGPEVLTRREIVEAAFEAVGKPLKTMYLSPAVARLMGYAMWPLNPRVAQLTHFVSAVSTQNVLAPARGRRRLADYFGDVVTAD